MSTGSESGVTALENLSALCDGELDPGTVARTCSAWREDASLRSSWHAYHLIADVLRSEDLACAPRREAAMLAVLRRRLAAEPIVLAPEPTPHAQAEPSALPLPSGHRAANAGRASRWSWMAPSAVAAGFVLVAGALVVTRTPLPGGVNAESLLARAGIGTAAAPQPVSVPALAAVDASQETPLRLTGKVIRDSQLDRYLAAHQQFAGTSALGVPSGFLRNAAADMPNR